LLRRARKKIERKKAYKLQYTTNSIQLNKMAATIQKTLDLIASWSVEDQLSLMHSISGRLLGHGAAIGTVSKSKASKAAKDPDAPKRESNWWIKATQHVRAQLAETIAADKEAGVKVDGKAPIRVASMLKDAGEMSAEHLPTQEEIVAMYEKFKADPPPTKSSSASVASKGSGTSSKKSKFSELSEEEQKARRSEAAKKAAATRAANKAAKESAPQETAPTDVGEHTDGRTICTFRGKRYLRIDNCLWDAGTEKWVGELGEDGTIDTKAEEPEFE